MRALQSDSLYLSNMIQSAIDLLWFTVREPSYALKSVITHFALFMDQDWTISLQEKLCNIHQDFQDDIHAYQSEETESVTDSTCGEKDSFRSLCERLQELIETISNFSHYDYDLTAFDLGDPSPLHLLCDGTKFLGAMAWQDTKTSQLLIKLAEAMIEKSSTLLRGDDKHDLVNYPAECDGTGGNLVEYDVTALHLACASGHSLELVQLLVRNGGDLEDRDDQENTSLHFACRGLVQRVDMGDSERGTYGVEALKIVAWIVQQRADLVFAQNSYMEGMKTPMHLAAWHGNVSMVRYFIESVGMNANLWTDAERTKKYCDRSRPLHLACENGYLHIVQYLVEREDADLVSVETRGYTPLGMACLCGHEHIVRYLVLHHNHRLGSSKEQKFGRDALYYMLSNEWCELKRELAVGTKGATAGNGEDRHDQRDKGGDSGAECRGLIGIWNKHKHTY